jgi:hypothetical protein
MVLRLDTRAMKPSLAGNAEPPGKDTKSIGVAAAYIAISIGAVRAFDLSFVFPQVWSPAERAVESGFLIGAFVQVLLVLIGAFLLGLVDLHSAIRKTFSPTTRKAWTHRGVAMGVVACAVPVHNEWLMRARSPLMTADATTLRVAGRFGCSVRCHQRTTNGQTRPGVR